MSKLSRNHEKIAGWLLVIAFMFSSSFGAVRTNCCCTVLDFDQTRFSSVAENSQTDSLSRPACCLPKLETAQSPECCDSPVGLSSNCDCQFNSGLVAIEPFKAKLDFSDTLVGWTPPFATIIDARRVEFESAEQAIDSQTRCSLQCSWQE